MGIVRLVLPWLAGLAGRKVDEIIPADPFTLAVSNVV